MDTINFIYPSTISPDNKVSSIKTPKVSKTPKVKSYVSINNFPKKDEDKELYIIKDIINITNNDDIKTKINTDQIPISSKTIMINYDYKIDTKNMIKTNEKIKQDGNINDFCYLAEYSDEKLEEARLWFKDDSDPDKLTWVISGEISKSTSKHTIKNLKKNKYLNPGEYKINGTIYMPPIGSYTGKIIGKTKLSNEEYEWNITIKNGKKYIHTNEDLYLTYYGDKYRLIDSITLEPFNITKCQSWIIEQEPNTFKRATLDKVLKYTNGDYIKKMMDSIPFNKRYDFYKEIQAELPQDQRLPELMLFIRSLTNNFMTNSGKYIDHFDAVQYVSKYISQMAEKAKGEKQVKYLLSGGLLRNMYEDEIHKNPFQSKKNVLKKCVNIIFDQK
jgi:hypothetical protein